MWVVHHYFKISFLVTNLNKYLRDSLTIPTIPAPSTPILKTHFNILDLEVWGIKCFLEFSSINR